MKTWFLVFMVTVTLALTGCANLAPKPVQVFQLNNQVSTRVIIPNDSNIDGKIFTSQNFSATWNTEYYNGRITRQEVINVKNRTAKSFDFERRTDNGISGSGILYTVDYTTSNDSKNYIFEFKPTKYRKYQEGLVMSFAVPAFTETDLTDFIVSQSLYYKLEIDSQFNTESIFANFKRLAKEEPFRQGDRDPITGKIFKNKFSIPINNEKVTFSLETFPYRNGTKAIIYTHVPGRFTSDNTVDFNLILSEIRSKLESIVNS